MLQRLRNAVCGSVRAELSGDDAASLLDRCVAHNVTLWDLHRESADRIVFSVNVPDYFLLCRLARRAPCCVRVRKRRGLPFFAARLLRRRALLLSAVLCGIAVWWLTGAVWTIGVTGCETVTERTVLGYLREAGLTTGTRRRSVDSGRIRNALLLRDTRIGFVTVTMTGCHAEVEIRERTETTPIDDPTPCDVVADCAGVVLRLRVTAGRALVQVGETLLPGDRIATGRMESSQGVAWLTAARAEADVQSWRTLNAVCTSQIQAQSYTGKSVKRHYLVLGTRRFALEAVEKTSFAWYDKTIERHTLPLHEDLRFPVAIVTEIERELLRAPGRAEETTLSAALEQRMAQRLQQMLGNGSLTSARFSFHRGAPATGVIEAECVETTGVRVPLG